MVKTARNMSEETKVSVRNVRRDANEELREMQRENLLTEDDLKSGESDVQKLTDEFTSAIDKRLKSKERRHHGGVSTGVSRAVNAI